MHPRKAPGLRGSIAGLFRREMLETHAVDRASFTIEAGEIVDFLGPNGSGKTTTLKMLCELLYPSGGATMVLGLWWSTSQRLRAPTACSTFPPHSPPGRSRYARRIASSPPRRASP